jgi:hypothetical protein
MTVIDFAPGQHGHFLEYVVNKYIFNINASIPTNNLFQSSGAAHNINNSLEYQKRKIVFSGHYSSFNFTYPDQAEKIIWIDHAPNLDFILLTNIYHRCHPNAVNGTEVNIHEITQLHQDAMFDADQTLQSLRNNWYTKLQERHFEQTKLKNNTNLPVFDFKYSSFFSLAAFIEHLQQLADFLNFTFVYNQSFVELYQKFIEVNQGYNQYCKALRIVDAILTNQSCLIDQQDWQLQAYINHQLSKLFKIYDGVLHDRNDYPSDTLILHNLVVEFVNNYDNIF